MEYTAFIGLTAAVFTVLAFLPQLLKVVKTRSTKDISLVMLSVFCGGNISWVIYGISIRDAAVAVANLLVFIQVFIIVMFKLRYK